MVRKDLKIPVHDEIKQQFELAKADMGAGTHEEALIELILRCSENDELDVIDEDVLKQRLQKKY